jgi:hypothetical protein
MPAFDKLLGLCSHACGMVFFGPLWRPESRRKEKQRELNLLYSSSEERPWKNFGSVE